MKELAVLGSTGSIGMQTLQLAERFPNHFRVRALAAGKNVERLCDQIIRHQPHTVSVSDEVGVDRLARLLRERGASVPEILHGTGGAIQVATLPVDCVMSAMVGAAGLEPTFAAINAGREVAIANKEALVMAGELVMTAARASGARIFPVDSEHAAVKQSIGDSSAQDIQKVFLTASGGPFLHTPLEQLNHVTPQMAVAHPRWNMGAKISVDSATLLNKGFEVIEARWLFDLPWTKIDVLIHPESVVHALVEFVDGSVIAQMAVADMQGPIANALEPSLRLPGCTAPVPFAKLGALHFSEPDPRHFPALPLALSAGREGGLAPVHLVAADDIVTAAFLEGRLPFVEIVPILRQTLERLGSGSISCLDDVLEAARRARLEAEQLVRNRHAA